MNTQEKIKLFTSLFKGRTDVFARRWERWGTDISGYSPAYIDKEKQKYLVLDDSSIEQHLSGNIVMGIYPLLTDNTSWFVVADFDGENWLEEAKRFFSKCSQYSLPGYIERSRSGNGGHVWFFFSQPYPAHKSRKIFLHLIKESGNIDQFDKEDSFDRLFPNQDYHSGKGLGNLIALPLQGSSVRLNNSIFLDPNHEFIPFEDQWNFLNTIEHIPQSQLDKSFDKITGEKTVSNKKHSSKNLTLTVGSYISIPKQAVSKPLATFLTERLNFFNSDYLIRRNMGLSVYKIEKYFKAIAKDDNNILIPRGFLSTLIGYLNDQGIDFTLQENLNSLESFKLESKFNLFDYQKEALDYFNNQDHGILVAPPGSGKTIMGLAIIAKKSQPALIITHRKQIYNQWLERTEAFLNIPKKNIGQYSIKKEIKSPVTVAMIQTLAKAPNLKEISDKFGLVLVDECHHMPARTFRDVITQFSPKYLYGLTATPTRKNNDEKLIFVYLGDILHTVPKDYNQQNSTIGNVSNKLRVLIKETDLSVPFKVGVAQFPVLSKILTFDTRRNCQYRDKNVEYLEKLFKKRAKYYKTLAPF